MCMFTDEKLGKLYKFSRDYTWNVKRASCAYIRYISKEGNIREGVVIMANWIYLKNTDFGFDEIKAVALASVLSNSSEMFYIVHTNIVSKYVRGLKNVLIGNPGKNEKRDIIILDLPDYAPFQILCKKISEILNIKCVMPVLPFLGFTRKKNEIDRQLSIYDDVILFCYYSIEGGESLCPKLENVVRSLNEKSYLTICCGPKSEVLIKGTFDFRELIQIDEIIKNRERIKVIVTSTALVKEIGLLLGIPVIFLFSYSFIIYYENVEIVQSTLTDCVQKLTGTIINICNKKILKRGDLRVSAKHKFEVPYSFDEEILPYYSHYSSYINFLFLPPFFEDSINTRTCTQSRIKGFSYMPPSREEYEYHLKLIKERNLRFVVLWQDKDNIISKDFLDYYTKIGASGFIIANDVNAKIIKDYNSKLLVISSIVQRLCKGISIKNFKYYDYCVLYYPFNRSLDAIKKLLVIKEKLVLMPNSFCHTDCPGVQHWFVKDMDSFEFEKLCPAYKDSTKCTFIYPEHLYLFDDYVGGYKLQGREWSTDYVITVCESYFNRLTTDGLIAVGINKELREEYKKYSLEDYYNVKTNEIIDLI